MGVLLQILFCLSMKILQIRLMWLRNWLMDNLFSNRISKFQTLLKFGPHTIVACDVMWLILKTPVLGDVRTNIRCRNRANYGGTNQTSSMYEAAGDDFNFFFMIGPPPMSDIRNVRSISTFPTGNTITVDTSSAASVNQLDTVLSFFSATFSPAIAQNDDAVYNIAESSKPHVTVFYTDTTTEDVAITDCTLVQNDTPQS